MSVAETSDSRTDMCAEQIVLPHRRSTMATTSRCGGVSPGEGIKASEVSATSSSQHSWLRESILSSEPKEWEVSIVLV
jgi:hypothetical protein